MRICKRLTSVLVCVALISIMFCSALFNAMAVEITNDGEFAEYNSESFNVVIGDVTAPINSVVRVPVSINNNPGFWSCTLSFKFDTNSLTPVLNDECLSISAGNIFLMGEITSAKYLDNGIVKVMCSSSALADKMTNGILFYMYFKVNKSASVVADDSTTIAFTDYDTPFLNLEREEVVATYKSGNVTFSEESTTTTVTTVPTTTVNTPDLPPQSSIETSKQADNDPVSDDEFLDRPFDENSFAIAIDDVSGVAGEEVCVPVRIINNPGIHSGSVDISYNNHVLTPVLDNNGTVLSTTGSIFLSGECMSGPVFTNAKGYSSFTMTYANSSLTANKTNDGVIFYLYFKINENAENGITTSIVYTDYKTPFFNSDGETVDCTYKSGSVTVATCTSIELSSMPSKLSYFVGDSVDVIGGKITARFSNGTSLLVDLSERMVSSYDFSTEGTKSVTITYLNQSVSYDVTVNKAPEVTTVTQTQSQTAVQTSEKADNDPVSDSEFLSRPYNKNAFNLCIDDVAGVAGSEVTVPVRINNNPGIHSVAIDIAYNSDYLTPVLNSSTNKVDVIIGDVFAKSEGMAGPVVVDANGVSSFSMQLMNTALGANKTTDGVLFYVKFKINANAKVGTTTSLVYVSYHEPFFNCDGEEVECTYKEGSVTVATCSGISIKSMPNKTEYKIGEKLDLTGATLEVSYSNGMKSVINISDDMILDYDFSTAGAKSIIVSYNGLTTSFDVNVLKAYIRGDANNDEKINIADVLIMRKHLAKWKVTINFDGADTNGDSKVTMSDVLLLRKYLAKWNVKFAD